MEVISHSLLIDYSDTSRLNGNQMKEIFKDVNGYEDYYKISNHGNLISKTRKVYNYVKNGRKLKPIDNGHGYLSFNLVGNNKNKRKYIHRLVVEHFISQIPSEHDINHKDGNKKNNHIRNLEIVTRSENQKHAFSNKIHKTHYGIKMKHSKSGLSNISPKINKGNFFWNVCLRMNSKRYEKSFQNIYEAIVYHNSIVREYGTNEHKKKIHSLTSERIDRFGSGLCSYSYAKII